MKKKLKDVCRTRWVARVDGMNVFEDLYVSMFYAFQEMSENAEKQCNPATSSKATTILATISSFTFIVSLVIARQILDMTLPVTQLLQAKNNDILDGIELIQSLKNLSNKTRTMVDSYHNEWYKRACQIAEEVGVEESLPRAGSRYNPSLSISNYYKKEITIPVLDHQIRSLNDRFSEGTVHAINGLSVIPAKMISLVDKCSITLWKDKFKIFSKYYQDDMPSPSALDGELELWYTYWVNFKGSYPNSISSTLKAITFDSFANIKVALQILGTLPIT